jgi:hypothetical protein
MEISRSGEMVQFLMFNEIMNHQFRIISIDKEKLVVERLDISGKPHINTLLKQKKIPVPMKLKDYFKDNK